MVVFSYKLSNFYMHTHTHKGLSLSADSSDVQLTWLRALETTDVQILPAAEEVEDLVKNAKSIYEFEAKDIDGNVVSLERYRCVCVIPLRSHVIPLKSHVTDS